MKIGDRIKSLRNALNISQTELANRVGTTKQNIYKYENGIITNIPSDKVEQIAMILETTPAHLMGWDEEPASIKESMEGIENIIPLPKTHKIPLLGNIACGEPITAVENIDTYVDMPDCVSADFALTCKGDSMIDARIYNGDIVYIREQPEVENGEIAAVLIDGEATLKRVYYQRNKIILQPENKKYEPLVYVGEEILDVRILGKATYFLSKAK